MTTTIEQNDDNDDFFADISILLEGNLPSTVKHFEFAFIPTTTRSSSSSSPPTTTKTTTSVVENKSITKSTTKRRRRTIHVDLHVVDDDPGSIRSGHYLWDAAPALCDYLIHQHHHHCHLSSQQQLPPLHECQQQPAPTTPLVAPQSIIELGAGCGLPSLVALQLYSQSIQCLIVSDRDPTVLERARNSYESTMEKLMHKEKDDNDDDDNDDDEEEEEEEDGQELVLDCRDQLGSIPVAFETLEWGCHNDIHHRQQSYSFLDGSPHIKNLLSSTNNRRRYETGRGIISDDKNNYLTIDLILGSDLIDCIEIVEPLFHTAYDLMHDESILILSQSFLYDSETEAKIQEICNELLLERIIRYDNLSKKLEEMQVPLKEEEDAATNNRNEGVGICSGRNNSNENNETRTLLPGGGRHRIQEFKRRRK